MSFSAYIVRSAWAYPDERLAFVRLACWWYVKTAFRILWPKAEPAGALRRLGVAELRGCVDRPRPAIRLSRRAAARVAATHLSGDACMSDVRAATAPLVSVVMPCLNEEEAIGACIEKIQRTFADAGLDGEIVVCDNGSTDRSVAIAEEMGARVVHQPERGYGNAYLKGFASARGRYLVMGDADDTYDFTMIPQFLQALREDGNAFVTGSRYLGGGDRHITGAAPLVRQPGAHPHPQPALRHPVHRRVLRLPRLLAASRTSGSGR